MSLVGMKPLCREGASPIPGMAFYVQRPGYKHFGIYAGEVGGEHLFIHYSDKLKGGSGKIELTSMSKFAQDDVCNLTIYPDVSYSQDVCSISLERASSKLDEAEYHLLFNNCEHFATWCVTGAHHSAQILEAVIGLIASPREFIAKKAIETGVVVVKRTVKKNPGIALCLCLIGGLYVLSNTGSKESDVSN